MFRNSGNFEKFSPDAALEEVCSDGETVSEKLYEMDRINQMTAADRLAQGMVSDICRPRSALQFRTSGGFKNA
jgi:hypothetical protein